MQSRKLDTTVTHFVGGILKYTILVFVVIAALGRVGVQTASFVAIIGAAGLAIGLALQGSLSNFAAGFLLIIFRPIKAGNLSRSRGQRGSYNLCSCSPPPLTSGDNKMVVVPNSAIPQRHHSQLFAHGHPPRRHDLRHRLRLRPAQGQSRSWSVW